jgi:uncharacterized protein YueI
MSRKPNPWVEHIKATSKRLGISYGCAMSEAKSTYTKTKHAPPPSNNKKSKKDIPLIEAHKNEPKEYSKKLEEEIAKFEGLTEMDALRRLRNYLILKHHPDKGGNDDVSRTIMNAYRERVKQLQPTASPTKEQAKDVIESFKKVDPEFLSGNVEPKVFVAYVKLNHPEVYQAFKILSNNKGVARPISNMYFAKHKRFQPLRTPRLG